MLANTFYFYLSNTTLPDCSSKVPPDLPLQMLHCTHRLVNCEGISVSFHVFLSTFLKKGKPPRVRDNSFLFFIITPAEFLHIMCDLTEVVSVGRALLYLCQRLTEYIWDKTKFGIHHQHLYL